MYAPSDNRPPARVVTGLCALAALLGLAGCDAGPRRIYPQAQVAPSGSGTTSLYTYPPVPQVVTLETWGNLLSRYRGRPLVICLWRASHAKAVPALHEATEVQAQYAGSRILGVNLDPPEEWLSVTVPTLRQGAARFPCVSIPEGERGAVLERLGLSGEPPSVTYVVFNGEGRRIAARTAFEPAGQALATATKGSEGGAGKPAAARPAEPQEPVRPVDAAAAPLAAKGAEGSLLYRLRMVRIADDAVVAEITGVGQAGDLATEAAGQEAASEMPGWLRMIGWQVASHAKRGETVAIAPVRYEAGPGQGAPDDLGARFSMAIAEATKRVGRGVVGPAEVQQACASASVSAELLAVRPSSAAAVVGATYLITGTVTAIASGDPGQEP